MSPCSGLSVTSLLSQPGSRGSPVMVRVGPSWSPLPGRFSGKVTRFLFGWLCVLFLQKIYLRGAWGALLVRCLTLDFGPGHDLTVLEIEPRVGLCAVSLGFSLSPFLSLCPSPAWALKHNLSLSKQVNKLKQTNKNRKENIR